GPLPRFARRGEGLDLVGVAGGRGGALEGGFPPAEERVAEIVMGLVSQWRGALGEGGPVGLGGAFEIAETVGGGAKAHLETPFRLGRELFPEAAFVGGEGGGVVFLDVGGVASAQGIRRGEGGGRDEEQDGGGSG